MKIRYKILIGVVLLVILVRLVLPSVVLRYTNGRLANMKGYYGRIRDIDLSLYRGAYIINDIYLNKGDSVSKNQTRFFKSRSIDLAIEWRALFHGSLVGELVFNSPDLIFTKDKVEPGDVSKDTADFRDLLNAFMPLKVNRFEVHDGAMHYTDNTSHPKVDVSLKRTHILAFNLTNVANDKVELPSIVTAQASVYEGTLDFNMKLNALADDATFDLNAELKNSNLVLYNDFLRVYGNFDVNKGRFGFYTEMAAKGGNFKGYVKPVITDLVVVGLNDRNDSFFHKMWEYFIGGVGVVFKNQKEDQVATKVPLEGRFKNPKANILYAVWEVLRNAFVHALVPSIDYEINIRSVKTDKPEDKGNLLHKMVSDEKRKEEKKDK